MPKKIKQKQSNNQDVSQIEILRQGAQGEFWRIISETIRESIEYINDQMESEEMKDLTAEQYKFTNELFKAKKEFLNMLIKTPENVMSWLGKPEGERKEFDPYDR